MDFSKLQSAVADLASAQTETAAHIAALDAAVTKLEAASAGGTADQATLDGLVSQVRSSVTALQQGAAANDTVLQGLNAAANPPAATQS